MIKLDDKVLKKTFVDKYDLKEAFSKDHMDKFDLYKLEKGETLYKLYEDLDRFYFLVNGGLKVFMTLENGNSLLIRFIKPLGYVGDLELGENRMIKTNVEAISDCYLIGIEIDKLKEFAYNDPLFLNRIINNLSRKLLNISNAMAINLSYPLENRFAGYLISLSEVKDDIRINEIKTKNLKEIATMLGSSYRQLCRVIKSFVEEGLIEKTNNDIKILKFDELKSISGGMYE